MAYGNRCPACGGTVDNNEFDFSRYMCKDCVEEREREAGRKLEIAKIVNSYGVQMRLEDICVLN